MLARKKFEGYRYSVPPIELVEESPGEPRAPRPGRKRSLREPSLLAVLCIAVLLELLTRRLLGRLLHIDLLAPPGWLRDSADFVGLFFFHVASLLGAALAVLGLAHLLIFPSVIPRGAKAAVGALAIAFMPLLGVAVWRPLPSVFALYLEASFTALILLIMLGGWLSPGKPRVKLGLFVLALPLALHFAWSLMGHQGASSSERARFVFWLGEVATVAAGLAAPPCFLPHRPRLRVALLGAFAAMAAAGVLAWRSWDIASRLVAYGFGLELPMGALGMALYVVALGAWTLTVLALLLEPGAARLRGYGVLLIGLSGFRHDLPFQIAALMVGFLAVVESLGREAPQATVAMFRALAQRMAVALGAAHIEVGGAEGYETARMRVTQGEESLEVALGRQAGAIAHAEVVIGHAPSEEAPPMSLGRRGTPRLGRTRGDEVATGDLAFDEAFRIFDSRHLTERDRVLDDDLRPRLIAELDGWLAVWPGEGVRYRTRNVGLLDGKLVGLIDLLTELKNRGAGS
ncbi:MAG: hypothetical protein EXR72_27025 [Myxococcales bacterium]|nr:hypothetical protein [Myxococcales bacterium]